jgi:hypothetical protein
MEQTRRNSARRLILVLESTCRTSSSSNAGVERGRWIFAASIPLLALIARGRLLSWCDLCLGANALNFSMAAEDTCERDGTIRRPGSARIVGQDINVTLESLCVLCENGLYPGGLRSGRAGGALSL